MWFIFGFNVMATIFQKFKISSLGTFLSLVISLATVISLAISVLNYYVLNNISPVISSLEKIDIRVMAIEKEIPAHATKSDLTEYFSTLKQRDDDIIHRLDLISNRLDRFVIK